MRIINNISSNHYQEILDIANNADELYIISPFLMESFETILFKLKNKDVRHIHLATTLKENDVDLFQKANALRSFRHFCKQNEISFKIYVDNKLHGKIYVASRNGTYTSGLLTSANFTNSGLNHNHEWGIRIDDMRTLEALVSEVLNVSSKPLSEANISSIIETINNYSKTRPKTDILPLELSVDEFIESETSHLNQSIDTEKPKNKYRQEQNEKDGWISKLRKICKSNDIHIGNRNNFNYANRAKNRDTFNIDPNINRFSQDWWLLLNEPLSNKLHVFKVLANSLQKENMKFDENKPTQFFLRINCDGRPFEDKYSKTSFDKWYVKTIDY